MIDAERFLSLLPHRPRISLMTAARVLYPLPFLPSFYHHSARSNRWSNPDFLLIAARGTRACKALSRRSNVRYPGECFLRRFHGNEKTQKAHRNYFAVVDRRSPRARPQ